MLYFNWIFLGSLFFFHVFLAQILQHLLHAYIQKNEARNSRAFEIFSRSSHFIKIHLVCESNKNPKRSKYFTATLFVVLSAAVYYHKKNPKQQTSAKVTGSSSNTHQSFLRVIFLLVETSLRIPYKITFNSILKLV